MSVARRRSWTGAVRERAVGALPPEKLLPDSQPAYMASWIYVFGVLSLVSLVLIIASGAILSLKGPGWWHFTGVGHFFNSIHLWAVALSLALILVPFLPGIRELPRRIPIYKLIWRQHYRTAPGG
jgi:amino acid transporter